MVFCNAELNVKMFKIRKKSCGTSIGSYILLKKGAFLEGKHWGLLQRRGLFKDNANVMITTLVSKN